MCPCEEEGEQTTDQLIFQFEILRNQRNELIKQIKKKKHLWRLAYDECNTRQ
jgi:hypothetical protein